MPSSLIFLRKKEALSLELKATKDGMILTASGNLTVLFLMGGNSIC